jgi:Predicted unsaturated glucuronyl hydrolase involved in regulation of bacterial surface properties, and related proteins
MKLPLRCSALFAVLLSTALADSGGGKLVDFPESADPLKIGKLVTERFLETPHPNFGNPGPPGHITYPEVVCWYGALTFAKTAGEKTLTERLEARFEPIFGEESHLVPKPDHVDNNVFGALALELHLQTGEDRYRALGMRQADEQWDPPTAVVEAFNEERKRLAEQGLSWQTRYWIDDMYMITLVQAQAFRSTGDRKYVDRAARSMVAYLERLQEPNGMFHHAPDVPFFWGRGNGWMAAGMTELLRSLPPDHPERPAILDAYRRMMATLLECQADDGMWRQLVDDPESWPETSCTAMFTFAMITGVKEGWLDAETYGPAARKGWLALTKYINSDGEIREVCVGTNKKNSREHYLNRPRQTGDMHGQAPVLWCATALLR